MFISDKNLLVVGVDHGFCLMKTPHHIFENGVHPLGGESTLPTNTLEYNGEYFKVGEGRLPMMDVKTSDDNYFRLTLAAIAKEMDVYHQKHCDVILAVGLPFSRFAREKEDFRKYLLREGEICFRFGGKEYGITIQDVYVFPQCYAAIVDRLREYGKETLVVDIGSKTIDVIHTKNYVPVERSCTTIPEALIHCMAEINNAVYRRCNKRISEADIQQMMMTGKSLLPDSITTVIRDELKVFAENVEARLKENGYDPELTPTVYVGGGASVMRLFGNIRGVHICYQEDVRANAIGYEYLALQKKDRWLHE